MDTRRPRRRCTRRVLQASATPSALTAMLKDTLEPVRVFRNAPPERSRKPKSKCRSRGEEQAAPSTVRPSRPAPGFAGSAPQDEENFGVASKPYSHPGGRAAAVSKGADMAKRHFSASCR